MMKDKLFLHENMLIMLAGFRGYVYDRIFTRRRPLGGLDCYGRFIISLILCGSRC